MISTLISFYLEASAYNITKRRLMTTYRHFTIEAAAIIQTHYNVHDASLNDTILCHFTL